MRNVDLLPLSWKLDNFQEKGAHLSETLNFVEKNPVF